MKTENEYSSAIVDFIDRKSQKITRSMMYPITRIELKEFGIKTVKVFIIKNGRWVLE